MPWWFCIVVVIIVFLLVYGCWNWYLGTKWPGHE